MAESPYTGLTAKVTLAGNTIGYISGVTLDLSKDIIEILAFGMTYKEKVPAVKDWTASFDGTAAFAADGNQILLYEAFESGAAITIGVYLDDTTYFSGTGYMSSLSIDAAPDDKINLSGEIAGSNAVTFNVASTAYALTLVSTEGTATDTTAIAVTEAKGGSNSYFIKTGNALPSIGAILADNVDGWDAYTESADYKCVNGNYVTVAECVTATGAVVKRGYCVADSKTT